MHNDYGIEYSNDKILWNKVNQEIPYFKGITYGGGKFIAVGDASDFTIGYSNDGISWTTVSNSKSIILGNSVIYGNGKFVAVGRGENSIAYSNDGISWTGVSGSKSIIEIGKNIAWNGNKFVVVGEGKNSIVDSEDGISWFKSEQVLPPWESPPLFDYSIDVAWGNNKFVAVGNGKNKYTIGYSNFGDNWVGIRNSKSFWHNGFNGWSITWGRDKFITIGYDSENRLREIAYSNEGKSWTDSQGKHLRSILQGVKNLTYILKENILQWVIVFMVMN